MAIRFVHVFDADHEPRRIAEVQRIFRSYYGDVDGKNVGGNPQVDNTDYAAFNAAYRSRLGQSNYRNYLDWDNSMLLDAADYAQFQKRYAKALTVGGSYVTITP